jgi:phosphoglycolate phosphatase
MLIHLLLDFDGTLVDSSPGIYRAFLRACEAIDMAPPPEPVLRHLIGPPIQDIIVNIYPHLSPADLEQFRLAFRHEYDLHSFRLADWYPGTHDALRALSASKNTCLTIVTNKPTRPTIELLEAADLKSCFDSVIGIDYRAEFSARGSVFSSKAEAIAFALESTCLKADQSLYVGDTLGDQAAAATCNVTFVAATYGFFDWPSHKEQELHIDAFPQLITLLNERFKPFVSGSRGM